MTKWTAPDIASIRGDNSRPLQKIFGSLTEYLKDTLSQTTEVSQTYVRNGETTTLTIGTVVYLDAQQGDRATVKRAFNTSDATSAKTLGVVAENIPANSDGLVTTLGYLEKVNTSAFTAGQTLYLGATAGTFTATKPVAPNHMVYVGVVVRANAGNGIIYVRCQNGYELDEIHDVLITSPTTGDILMRNGSSLWINTPQTSITSVGTLTAGTVPASLLSGTTLPASIVSSSLTSVGTLSAGSIPATLLTGTIASARISGSYTGITGVGTLSAGSIPASLLTGTIASARLSGAYTGITGVGTLSAGSIPSSLLSGQTGMWSSANRPGPYRLYRRDSDDPFNVQTYWTGSRWRLYGYYGDSAHADTHVGYADSAGSASGVTSGGGGIPYPGATVGGGSPNGIGFRWTNPYVNCTVDNVISAPAANFSDRRLKTNIQTLTNGIELVRGLRCVTYNPLDVIGFEEETLEPIIGDLNPYDEMLGFIADEVQEVYANAIHGEGNRMKSIDTVQLLSMAVSAIQDLDARLQQLETV